MTDTLGGTTIPVGTLTVPSGLPGPPSQVPGPPGGPVGPQGPAATITVGTTTTGAPNSNADVVNAGSTSAAVLNFTIPEGIQGEQGIQGPATIDVGTTTTLLPGSNAAVTNSGDTENVVLDFDIPRGTTVAVGTTTTLLPGNSASVANSGTASDLTLDFSVPRGTTVAVGTTTTLLPGNNASVTNSGTASDLTLDFNVPRGTTLAVGTTTQLPIGQPAAVTNSGTASDIVLNFAIPETFAKVVVSDTPPTGVEPRTLWWDSSDTPGGGQMYFLYQGPTTTQWVLVSPPEPGPQGLPGVPPDVLPMASRVSPVMLSATTAGIPNLAGIPRLTRIGNMVTWNYQGNNKASATANTFSLAEIPPGYTPTGNVSQAITLPAGNITVQQYTGATSVFPDAPSANQAAGGLRWSVRFSANFGAGAPMSANVSWQTNDPMPP